MPSATCAWDTWVEPPTSSSSRQRGWSCAVTPTYSVKALGELPKLKEKLEAFKALYGSGDVRHDLALVRCVALSARVTSVSEEYESMLLLLLWLLMLLVSLVLLCRI